MNIESYRLYKKRIQNEYDIAEEEVMRELSDERRRYILEKKRIREKLTNMQYVRDGRLKHCQNMITLALVLESKGVDFCKAAIDIDFTTTLSPKVLIDFARDLHSGKYSPEEIDEWEHQIQTST